MSLSREQLLVLGERLVGTFAMAGVEAEKLGFGELEEDELEDQLLGISVERCPGCHWWTGSENILVDVKTEEPVACYGCCDSREEVTDE